MPVRFIFTEEAVKQIRKMRKDGRSLREIAKTIGCSRATLSAHGFNLGSLRRRFTEGEKRQMIAMRKQGRTLQQIAIVLGCYESSIRKHVRHLGLIPALQARPTKRRSLIPNETRRRVVIL